MCSLYTGLDLSCQNITPTDLRKHTFYSKEVTKANVCVTYSINWGLTMVMKD